MKPFAHQRSNSLTLAEQLLIRKVGADRSEMGTGKTLTALLVAQLLDSEAIVVCPLAVKETWERWAKGLVKATVNTWEYMRRGNDPLYDGVTWRLPKRSVLIFDEAHRAKTGPTLNARMIRRAVDQGERILLLSGTLLESPMDCQVLGNALGLNPGGSQWWGWCRKWGCYEDFWGNRVWKPAPDIKARFAAEVAAIGVRTKLEDVQALPEDQVNHICVDLHVSKKVTAGLEHALKEHDEKVASGRNEDAPVVQLLRARQELELKRIPHILDLAKDAVAEGRKVVVFLNFTASMDLIPSPLGLIDSRTTGEARQKVVDIFNSDATPPGVLAVQSQSGGVGLSLHDTTGKYPRVSIISPSFDARELLQILGRIRRVGQMSKSVQYLLWAKGTVEEGIYRRLEQKSNFLKECNGDILNGPSPRL